MNLHALSRLPSSADVGWPDLIRARPGLLRIFAFLVLPLSLVPPVDDAGRPGAGEHTGAGEHAEAGGQP